MTAATPDPRRYRLPITHRPDRDGTTATSRHVPYFLAAEVLSDGWRRLLADLGPEMLPDTDVAVVHVELTFAHEIFVGEVDVTVTVAHVGTSSVRFDLAMDQGGRQVATASTVVVRIGDDRTASVPLSAEQRAALSS